MPMKNNTTNAAVADEVNAWGNYEQSTARNARTLRSRRGSTEATEASLRFRRQQQQLQCAYEDDYDGSATSVSGGDWAKLLGRRQSFLDQQQVQQQQPLIECEEADETTDKKTKQPTDSDEHTPTANVVEDAKKTCASVLAKENQAKYSRSMVNDARTIFAVYFEDYQRVDPIDSDDNDDDKLKTSLLSSSSSATHKTKNYNVWFWNATMPWTQSYIHRFATPSSSSTRSNNVIPEFLLFCDSLLRGIAQVYFQNNPLSGLFMLIGLLVQDGSVAGHGVLALVAGNLTALMLGFDRGLMQSGLFGYNGILVGLALATFISSSNSSDNVTPITVVASILFSAASSVLLVVLGKLLVPYKSPPLTLPFNIATLLFLLATAGMPRVAVNPVRNPALPTYTGTLDLDGDYWDGGRGFFKAVIRGIGQVFLADDWVAGLLIWLGIAVCSRIAAGAAFLGSVVGVVSAWAVGVPAAQTMAGLYGYNASLTFTSMFMFYSPSWGAGVLAVLSTLLTVAAQLALNGLLEPYGLPVMTLPFCFVALPFIVLQGTTNLVVAVPLATMTVPEDHLRRVAMLNDGFEFLKDAIRLDREPHIIGRRYGRGFSSSLRKMNQAIQTGSEVSAGAAAVNNKSTPGPQWRVVEHRSKEKDPWVAQAARVLFRTMKNTNSLDKAEGGSLGDGDIHESDFRAMLHSVGLTAKDGVEFASLVFRLMDLDGSQTVDAEEFLAFCIVTRSLERIRRQIRRFMDFVDSNGDGDIDLAELDAALVYLGESEGLQDSDRDAMRTLLPSLDYTGSIDVVELINFVTVSKVESLVRVFQESTEGSSTSGDDAQKDALYSDS